MLPFLLLLLSAFGDSESTPCSNFQEYACTTPLGKQIPIGSSFYVEAVPHLKVYGKDSVMKILEKAGDSSCRSRSSKHGQRPSQPGYLAAFGVNQHFDISVSVRKRTIEFVSTDQSRESVRTVRPFSKCPHGVQKHVRDFFSVVDPNRRFRFDRFSVTYDRDTLKEEASRGKRSVEEKLLKYGGVLREKDDPFGHLNFDFASYMNLLYAHILLPVNPDLVHSPELVDELHKMAFDIKGEITHQINETSWVTKKEKAKIVRLFESKHVHFGAPREFLNGVMVNEALSWFQTTFLALHNDTDVMQRLSNEEQSCPFFYKAIFRFAHNSFKLHHDDFDFKSYVSSSFPLSTIPYYLYNAFIFLPTNEIFFPSPFIYDYKAEYPLAFKYGSIGQTIGHEMFHAPDLNLLLERSRECYEEHYGSFTFTHCQKEGPTENCIPLEPPGAMKAAEGFADIQSVRAGVRAVQRLHGDKEQNLDLYFQGLGAVFCESYKEYRSKLDIEAIWSEVFFNAHPRAEIRVNAMVRQLQEFTDHFHCRPEEKMHREDVLCGA
ncbi:hypothetical protein QR680_008689 [Steinernema hermaphroditum]|uniref:Peptidase M13 C-terminal domain-containing protein n=1 Tax=Steinernema hermaphroditum TaxID=289476 RepID=A0AA39IJU2_9BILA|nr:hypothetical protein QR680_008689 [Steinernema hermaphroditum]